jgi:hypothetical protein
MELSKGGCKDFTEHVCYIKDPSIMDDDSYTQCYSYLEFKNSEGVLVLGNASDTGYREKIIENNLNNV